MNEPSEKLIYPIGIVAKLLEVSVHTIRLYEREGLILVQKTESGRRIFCDRDVERLRCIRRMILDKGLNLQGIKHLLAIMPCWQINPDCFAKDFQTCPAYRFTEAPCWTLEDKPEVCKNVDCYQCPVYQQPVDCNTIKKMFHERDQLQN
jgi:MerR family transcriptional regulator, heat shock protein HspR